MKSKYAFTVLLVLGLSSARHASGEEPKQSLAPCLGFDPRISDWGPVGVTGESLRDCPEGWAFMTVNKPSGPKWSGDKTDVAGTCCALPEGTLGKQRFDTLERCPDGSIGTGARTEERSDAQNPGVQQILQCTSLDTSRYHLSPPLPGVVVGTQKSMFAKLFVQIRGQSEERIAWGNVPASLRYAVGRSEKLGWRHVACIGSQPGSVLVGKHGKYCVDFEFSTIIDNATGAPLKVLPDCDVVLDPLDPATKCLSSTGTTTATSQDP